MRIGLFWVLGVLDFGLPVHGFSQRGVPGFFEFVSGRTCGPPPFSGAAPVVGMGVVCIPEPARPATCSLSGF